MQVHNVVKFDHHAAESWRIVPASVTTGNASQVQIIALITCGLDAIYLLLTAIVSILSALNFELSDFHSF